MRLKWKAVTMFATGVIFGSIFSFVSLLTLLDLHGQARRGSVGWYDVVSHEFLHHRLETMRDAQRHGLRIVCWVLTTAENHNTKAWAVRNTWGRRCDRLVFISSEDDHQLGAVGVKVKGGRKYLWGKTKAGLRYVYENYGSLGDWFLKADDDTYVIIENLRHLLSSKNSSELVYLGYRFKKYIPQGYMSGGAGYVLSAAALRRLVEVGLKNGSMCEGRREVEDLALGNCLYKLDIPAGDSRDELGRERFFPLPLQDFVSPFSRDTSYWIWRFSFYDVRPGLECCSDTAVAFHYLQPNDLYAYEYMIYYLRVRRTRGRSLRRGERALAPPTTINVTERVPMATALAETPGSANKLLRGRASNHRLRPLTPLPMSKSPQGGADVLTTPTNT